MWVKRNIIVGEGVSKNDVENVLIGSHADIKVFGARIKLWTKMIKIA